MLRLSRMYVRWQAIILSWMGLNINVCELHQTSSVYYLFYLLFRHILLVVNITHTYIVTYNSYLKALQQYFLFSFLIKRKILVMGKYFSYRSTAMYLWIIFFFTIWDKFSRPKNNYLDFYLDNRNWNLITVRRLAYMRIRSQALQSVFC